MDPESADSWVKYSGKGILREVVLRCCRVASAIFGLNGL